MHPLPDPTDRDIQRLITRDYEPAEAPLAAAILSRCRPSVSNAPVRRVCAAVLRLADGDLKRLEDYVSVALTDYRDVLLWAEFTTPGAAESGDRNRENRRAAFQSYWQWFHRA